MKLRGFIACALLLAGMQVGAQTKKQQEERDYYYRYPETALHVADSLFEAAAGTGNGALRVKAIIIRSAFTLVKDRGVQPQVLQDLESAIAAEKDTCLRSILHSYAAELYLQGYRLNRYAINQRTPLEGEVPQDMETWSANIWSAKIRQHFSASLAAEEALQNAPLGEYSLLLFEKNPFGALHPTLYDFLCYRASTILAGENFGKFPRLTAEAFLPAGQFVRHEFPSETSIPGITPPEIYQRWLAFRLRTDRRDALLAADLERLKYARSEYSLKNRDTLYRDALRHLMQEFADTPPVVEAIKQYADHLSGSLKLADIREALRLCEAGIRRFPDYPRIGILKQLVNSIKKQSLRVDFPPTVYPGEDFTCDISYRNVDACTLKFYRLPDTTLYRTGFETEKLPEGGKLVREIPLTLPELLLRQDTSVQIKGLPAGLYAITIHSDDPGTGKASTLLSTRLFCSILKEEGKSHFQIHDWNSGLPVKNCKIHLYTREDGLFLPMDSLVTDREGRAVYAQPDKKETYYRVVGKDSPAGQVHRLYDEYPHRQVTQQEEIQIITDRKIYRPGQTVYFKGYHWLATLDSLRAIAGKKMEVILQDANRREVAATDAVSNGYGTFSGSFTLPAKTLNGRYAIKCGNATEYITVAEYKRPEFEIRFQPLERRYYQGDTVHLKGSVENFTGTPVQNANLTYRVERMYSRFSNTGNLPESTLKPDGKGEFEITFKTEPALKSVWNELYVIEVTATDSRGETQTERTEVTVYSGKSEILIDLPRQADKTHPVDCRISLPMLPADVTQKVDYTLYKLTPPRKPADEWTPLDRPIADTVLSGTIAVGGSDTLRFPLHKAASGAYALEASMGDIISCEAFYLYSPKDKRPPVPLQEWVVEEKTACNAGEKARILFGTSYHDVHVRYEVFARGKSVLSETERISNGILPIEFTYQEAFGAQVQVRITFLKDKHRFEQVIPVTRLDAQPQLKVETSAFRDRLRPGKEEQWEFRITQSGKGAKAEVLAMMYDASLDKLAPYQLYFKPMQLIDFYIPRIDTEYAPWRRAHLSFHPNHFPYGQQTYPALEYNRLNTFYNSLFMENIAQPVPRSYVGSAVQADTKVQGYPAAGNMQVEEDAVETATVAAPVQLRQNLRETAFFYPQLETEEDGTLTFGFTVPDALTRWRFVALATTKEMATGMLERYVTTTKPLMVRPNLPRFLRRGDAAEITAGIQNLSDSLQAGTVTLELFYPATGEVLLRQTRDFTAAARGNALARFAFDVQASTELLACRIVAKSGDFSDGEQHYLPVLPDKVLVNTTLPIFLNTAGDHTFSIAKQDVGQEPYRLTFELVSNPVWYAVQALPHLQEPAFDNVTDISAAYYVNTLAARIVRDNPEIVNAIRSWQATPQENASPLEQHPELKSILMDATPWATDAQSQTEQIRRLAGLFDDNRLEYLQKKHLARLAELQNPQGAWCWFKGMYPGTFMTMNVLDILQRTTLAGTPANEQVRTMQMKGIRYLDTLFAHTYRQHPPTRLTYDDVLYLHTRSLYRDIPLGDALEAHKHLMELARKQWGKASLYEKALLALTLHRYGFEKEAKNILESLRQYAVTTPADGMWWPNNRNHFHRNSAVQVHTALMEAFQTIEGDTQAIDRMQQWLLRQKQVQHWGSVPATVDAIHALLTGGGDFLARENRPVVRIGKHTLRAEADAMPLGNITASFPAAEITQDMLEVHISQSADDPAWGGLYLQSFQPLDAVRKHGSDISVEKKLYVERPCSDKRPALFPIEGEQLKPGDKVVVRLVLTLTRDMEYLHLQDLRAACLEPVEQISGIRWLSGTPCYRDTKDAATHLFFTNLSRGTHVIEYPLWVARPGTYQDGIATLQCLYAPAYSAHSNATTLHVTPQ